MHPGRLIAIPCNGRIDDIVHPVPESLEPVLPTVKALYQKTGFVPPWLCYIAVEDGVAVGTCGFKTPPQAGRVEIAYYTFPPHEGRGVATRMAGELIAIARSQDGVTMVTAQTLPEEGASTRILKRLGFELAGEVNHPDDGRVWEWNYLL